ALLFKSRLLSEISSAVLQSGRGAFSLEIDSFDNLRHMAVGRSRVKAMKTLEPLFAQCTRLVLLAASVHCLQAGPIPKLFNTGVDDSGALLAASSLDPHYTITASRAPTCPD